MSKGSVLESSDTKSRVLQLREIVPLDAAHGHAASSSVPFSVGSGSVVLAVGGGSSAPPVAYRCPIYLVAAGSLTLRSLVEDLVEDEQAHGGILGHSTDINSSNNNNMDKDSHGGSGSGSSIPLPFLTAEMFESMALYWEHYFGVAARQSGGVTAAAAAAAAMDGGDDDAAAALGAVGRTPSSLTMPLRVQELCQLSDWDRLFVWHRLLRLEENCQALRQGGEATARLLTHNGAWVDALGCSPSSGCKALHTAQTSAPTEDISSLFKGSFFSLQERKTIMRSLCNMLEAATRLRVEGLQHLCAALIANMVVDLNDAEVRQVVCPPSLASKGASSCAAMSEEAKAKLLEKHAWLADAVRDRVADKKGKPLLLGDLHATNAN